MIATDIVESRHSVAAGDEKSIACEAPYELRQHQYTRGYVPATADVGGVRGGGVLSFENVERVCHGWNVMIRATPIFMLCWCAVALADTPRNDYPTVARVEYVQECISKNGGNLADLYKCSCAIDWIAERLTYDDFVEAGTFARYATLPGEGGAEFRDPDRAKERAKLYRSLETEAYRACGLKTTVPR